MNGMRQVSAYSVHSVIHVVLPASVRGLLSAREDPGELPANAHAKSCGGGRECKRGFRAVDEACIAIKVPVNGYLTDTSCGSGRACDYGYRAINGGCAAILFPVNGYPVDSTSAPGWRCDCGFRVENQGCVAVEVVENAHRIHPETTGNVTALTPSNRVGALIPEGSGSAGHAGPALSPGNVGCWSDHHLSQAGKQ